MVFEQIKHSVDSAKDAVSPANLKLLKQKQEQEKRYAETIGKIAQGLPFKFDVKNDSLVSTYDFHKRGRETITGPELKINLRQGVVVGIIFEERGHDTILDDGRKKYIGKKITPDILKDLQISINQALYNDMIESIEDNLPRGENGGKSKREEAEDLLMERESKHRTTGSSHEDNIHDESESHGYPHQNDPDDK